MIENLESVPSQVIETTKEAKRRYVTPTIVRLNETNIQSGSSEFVAENSNGGAFTNAS